MLTRKITTLSCDTLRYFVVLITLQFFITLSVHYVSLCYVPLHYTWPRYSSLLYVSHYYSFKGKPKVLTALSFETMTMTGDAT